MRTKLFALIGLILLLCGMPAHAQVGTSKTQTQLNTEINQLFPDQNPGAGLITPFNTRQTLLDIVASNPAAFRWGPTTPGLPTLATGELYYDQTGGFVEHNAALNISTDLGASAPSAVIASAFIFSQCQGNNTTFVGCAGLTVSANDRSSVNAGNKGVLYALNVNVNPSVARNNSPADDVNGVVIQNTGTANVKATEAIFIGHNTGIAGSEWLSTMTVAANADTGIRLNGTYNYGLDFVTGALGTVNNQAFRAPNNIWSGARNAANNADVNAWRVNASNLVSLANDQVTISPTTAVITGGINGGNGGSLILNGATSSHSTLSALATGGTLQVSSGQSSAALPLYVADTASGSSVVLSVQNLASTTNTSAQLQLLTGLANSSVIIESIQTSPSAALGSLFWASGVTGGLQFSNNGTVVATFNNGVQIGAAPTGGDKGANSINIQGTIWTNGTQGIVSRTCTVNTNFTLIFTNGILTGGTCVS